VKRRKKKEQEKRLRKRVVVLEDLGSCRERGSSGYGWRWQISEKKSSCR
jgi:hypothetical protein